MESSNLIADKINQLMNKATEETKETMNKLKGNGKAVSSRRSFSSISMESSNMSSVASSEENLTLKRASSPNVPMNSSLVASESELSMLKTNNNSAFTVNGTEKTAFAGSSRAERSATSIGASSIPFSISCVGSELAEPAAAPAGLVFYSTDGKYKMKLELNKEKENLQLKYDNAAKPNLPSNITTAEKSSSDEKPATPSGSVVRALISPINTAKEAPSVAADANKNNEIGGASTSLSKLSGCNTTFGTKITIDDCGLKHSLRLKGGLLNGKLDGLVINGHHIKLAK